VAVVAEGAEVKEYCVVVWFGWGGRRCVRGSKLGIRNVQERDWNSHDGLRVSISILCLELCTSWEAILEDDSNFCIFYYY